jgi:hypothetical protein
MHPVGTNITGINFVRTLHIHCIFILWFAVVVVVVVVFVSE